MTPAQYGMFYRQAKPKERANWEPKEGRLSAIRHIVGLGDQVFGNPMVEAHLADDRLMILRSKPILIYAADQEKKDEHSRLYGEIILYCPWYRIQEATEFGQAIRSLESCQERHSMEPIDMVKERLRNLLVEEM